MPDFTLMLGCYALAAIGLCFCLALFLTIKQDMFRMERRMDSKQTRLEERLAKRIEPALESLPVLRDDGSRVRLSLAALGERVDRMESLARPEPVRGQAAPMPIRLGSRQRVIQLANQGKATESIAAAVRLPRNEIELLLKVHRAIAS